MEDESDDPAGVRATLLIEDHLGLTPVVVNKRWPKVQTADREDLQQAGAIGLIGAARRFDPRRSRGRFVAFAQRCIHGAATDHWRREYRLRRGEVPLEFEPLASDGGFEELTVNDVREELMRELPERTATMARLYFFEGVSALEISQQFAVSESMAFRLLRPVRERLRELLRG